MDVLIACEESQRVCMAFREKGHDAFSCDIQECSGGYPQYHIKGDVLPILNGDCDFTTQDGQKYRKVGEWDLIIAHPPYTRLCNLGTRWLYYGSEEYRNKKQKERDEAIKFFMEFVNCKCEHIAIENPVGIMSNIYRKPDVIYNPYDFKGETECKKTCLWLKNLPKLEPNQILPKAMAEQWGKIL